MPNIMLDSDGVMANFDLNVMNHFNAFPWEMKDDIMWNKIHSTESFWPNMPVMNGAFEFWDRIKHLNPPILTGCHKNNFDFIAKHKVIWWKTLFNHENIITCLSKNKSDYMINPGDILIDDMSKNIKRWEKAGGVGILFQNHDQVITDLQNLGIDI